MTVNAVRPVSGPHIADGTNRNWPFNFKAFNVAHMALYITDADGSNGIDVFSGFTIADSGLNNDLGGIIVYPVAPVAPLASSKRVVPYRVAPYDQSERIGNQGGFFPETHERALDDLSMQVQQLEEIAHRSLQVQRGDTPIDVPGLLSNIASAVTQVEADKVQVGLDRVQTGLDRIATSAWEAKAEQWAENPEDDDVEPGLFSAKHWATKSSAFANSGLINASTVTSASLTTFPVSITHVRTSGYSVVGDGGGALYKRVVSQPTHAGKFQSVGGTWWEIADVELKLRSFGAVGDGSVRTTEVLAAFTAGVALGRTVVDHGGIYTIAAINTSTLVGLRFRGAGMLTQFRPSANSITMFSFILSTGGGCFQEWRNFDVFCNTNTGVKAFQFTKANVFTLEDISFFGCSTNYDIDQGGHYHLDKIISNGTTTLKAGGFKIWSSDDTKYGGAFSSFGVHEINNNGNGVQSPAFYFRRAVAIRFQPNSIIANNDGTFQNTGSRVGTCILVENDCQGLNIGGVIAGYNVGLVLQTGTGVNSPPIVNDFSHLDIDQCFTRAIEITNGDNITLTDVHVTSSAVATGTVGAVWVKSTAGKIRFNNLRVSGYYTGSGTAIFLDSSDKVIINGGLITGCAQGISIASATNLRISGVLATETPVGRVGNPGSGTIITDCVGINPYDPWIPTNPVAVAGSGTLGTTTTTLRRLKKDTRVHFSCKVAITTNGSGATNIQVPMPFTAFFDTAGAGREVTAAGIGLNWSMSAGSSTLIIAKVDSTYPGGSNFTLIVSGVVEEAN